MSLKDLELRLEYRSDSCSLVDEFFQPCLRESHTYRRAVGYFTSRGLSAAAEGLFEFIQGNGTMFLVASPHLEAEDLEAMKFGYELRQQRLEQNLFATFEQCFHEEKLKCRLECLSWLIAHGRLEIKLAITRSGRSGIYHEKIGIFEDRDGHLVAFTGSPNETIGGLISNFESVDVYSSWRELERVQLKARNFELLWADRTNGLSIIDLPEAAKRRLIEICPDKPPVPQKTFISMTHDPAPEIEDACALWPHQLAAIQAWQDAGRRGLLSMATGSGKTITALTAMRRTLESYPGLCVIAVPRDALVDQWAGELERMSVVPVKVYRSADSWQNRLFTHLVAARDEKTSVVVVGTLSSLTSAKFCSVKQDAGVFESSLIIVDEAHNAGSLHFRKVLEDGYSYRLGLSATPSRHFDDEGTDILLRYFGSIVYEYTLDAAIRDGFLCRYTYHLRFAALTEGEYKRYQSLSVKIQRLITDVRGPSTSGDLDIHGSEDIRQLMIRRARIIKKCQSKPDVLRESLGQFCGSRTLIYCADQEQLEDTQAVLDEKSLIYGVYTANSSIAERKMCLESLRDGHLSLILAIDCLDEGVDVPSIDTAIILASSTSSRQFVQRRGRVLRKAPGKESATIVDVITLPPASKGTEATATLRNELIRVHELCNTADNKDEVLLSLHHEVERYGITLSELVCGEVP